jgi:flagellum-specific peptidoglycan hydrolase FlgJ
MTTQESFEIFVKKYLPFAQQAEKVTGIPALFILAQSALETGYGGDKPGNMMFGVKADKYWTGKKQLLRTTEAYFQKDSVNKYYPPSQIIKYDGYKAGKHWWQVRDYFRAYDSPADSFADYGRTMLNTPAFKAAVIAAKGDAVEMTKQIDKSGYATGSNYGATILSIMNGLKAVYEKFKNEIKTDVAAASTTIKKNPIEAVAAFFLPQRLLDTQFIVSDNLKINFNKHYIA